MIDQPISNAHHQSQPWLWQLDKREAVTLCASNASRWLRVDDGCVWVTARKGGPDAEDIWLHPGQSLALPAGSAWVLQAWPRARLSLLLAAPAAIRRDGGGGISASPRWWPAWLHAGRA